MKIIDCIQGSDEWHQARCGKFTASKIQDVMAKTKTGVSASRKKVVMRVALERISGKVEAGYNSSSMDRGTEMEPEACDAFSFETGLVLHEVGIVAHQDWDYFTCSPDRLVGDDGLLEIKCPEPSAHMKYLEAGSPYKDYIKQVQAQLLVTGRKFCYVTSYNPDFEGLELAWEKVLPDLEMHKEMMKEIAMAQVEVNAIIEKLETMKQKRAA